MNATAPSSGQKISPAEKLARLRSNVRKDDRFKIRARPREALASMTQLLSDDFLAVVALAEGFRCRASPERFETSGRQAENGLTDELEPVRDGPGWTAVISLVRSAHKYTRGSALRRSPVHDQITSRCYIPSIYASSGCRVGEYLECLFFSWLQRTFQCWDSEF
jgi:hypothetical protein